MDTTQTTINYDDFAKLDLRVATVLECRPHANADKLLVLQIELAGGEKRQICAGLRQHYPPVGRLALTGHAHLDIAWLWPVAETRRKGRRTFATVPSRL